MGADVCPGAARPSPCRCWATSRGASWTCRRITSGRSGRCAPPSRPSGKLQEMAVPCSRHLAAGGGSALQATRGNRGLLVFLGQRWQRWPVLVEKLSPRHPLGLARKNLEGRLCSWGTVPKDSSLRSNGSKALTMVILGQLIYCICLRCRPESLSRAYPPSEPIEHWAFDKSGFHAWRKWLDRDCWRKQSIPANGTWFHVFTELQGIRNWNSKRRWGGSGRKLGQREDNRVHIPLTFLFCSFSCTDSLVLCSFRLFSASFIVFLPEYKV